MQFKPFVFDRIGQQIPVSIVPMTRNDAESTSLPPVWQTSWMSEYLAQERFEKYAAKVGGELIALGAYEILNGSLVVHIVYMEAQPESNPNLDEGIPKYTGIRRLMIAYGIISRPSITDLRVTWYWRQRPRNWQGITKRSSERFGCLCLIPPPRGT